jgi:hypothetical protein
VPKNLTITLEQAKELYPTVSPKMKIIFENTFGREVFHNKSYEDYLKDFLKTEDAYYFEEDNNIIHLKKANANNRSLDNLKRWENTLISYKRAEQLQAITKLMFIADVLNSNDFNLWNIYYNPEKQKILYWINYGNTMYSGISFETLENAKKAVEILGEEVIKTALGVYL